MKDELSRLIEDRDMLEMDLAYYEDQMRAMEFENPDFENTEEWNDLYDEIHKLDLEIRDLTTCIEDLEFNS